MNSVISKIFKGDKWIWGVFGILLLMSALIMFSASSSLAYKMSDYTKPIFKHVKMLIIGGGVALLITKLKMFKPTSKLFRVGSLLGLIASWGLLLYVMMFVEKSGDSARQIYIGSTSIQPSEFAKLFLLITVADIMGTENNTIAWLMARFKQGRDTSFTDKERFWWVISLSILTIGLIAPENLSTGALLAGTIFLLMFIDHLQLKWLGIAVVVGIAFLLCVYGIAKVIDAAPQSVKEFKPIEIINKPLHRVPTWESRAVEWWNNAHGEEKYKVKDKTRQMIHAQRAIARGSVAKFGPGTSIERDYLAEAYSDFLYAIIIEEYGIIGGIFVMLLYALFFIRSARVAYMAESRYQMMLVYGLSILIMFQALVNMLVSTSLMPVTGQPLPLLSKGGSAIVILSAYFGIILRVSMKEPKQETTIIDDDYETQIPD